MKQKNYSPKEIALLSTRNSNSKQKVFDWDKAGDIIKFHLLMDSDLKAEAGLQGDWYWTAGLIYQNGPITENHTYLSSSWATPTLIIFFNKNGEEREVEFPCYTWKENSRFNEYSKWDKKSIDILRNRAVVSLDLNTNYLSFGVTMTAPKGMMYDIGIFIIPVENLTKSFRSLLEIKPFRPDELIIEDHQHLDMEIQCTKEYLRKCNRIGNYILVIEN